MCNVSLLCYSDWILSLSLSYGQRAVTSERAVESLFECAYYAEMITLSLDANRTELEKDTEKEQNDRNRVRALARSPARHVALVRARVSTRLVVIRVITVQLHYLINPGGRDRVASRHAARRP